MCFPSKLSNSFKHNLYTILLPLFYLISKEAHEILLLIFAIVFIFK